MQQLMWLQVGNLGSFHYTCGYCSSEVASEKGWFAQNSIGNPLGWIFICHQCTRPTFVDKSENGKQTPSPIFGDVVKNIPDKNTEILYNEARMCTGMGCYTSAVLVCRKLLMHISVSLGAKPGENFISYVQYLSDNHYVPPGANGWVDHIRKKGNEANHEIILMKKEDAEELLAFLHMLLKVIYEFPASIQVKKTP